MMKVEAKYGARKIREGTVVSDKMDKTLVVAVHDFLRHPLYKKIVRRVRRYMAHDENGDARMGDRVRIIESRPLSRRKRWALVEVLERKELPEIAPEVIAGEVEEEIREATTVAQVEAEAALPVEEPPVSATTAAPETVVELPEEAAATVPQTGATEAEEAEAEENTPALSEPEASGAEAEEAEGEEPKS